jgi:serine/threonine protein kinase/TolA-binding protein
MSLKVGQTLGQYRILDKLGAGGMGVVYKAEDTRLGRLVALKVLPLANADDGDEATERFRREARTASSLNHSNICTIYNFDEQDGQLFLAMELLEGGTLDAKLSGHPLPLPLLLDLGTQIADALENAHTDGILHRDIKPANIFITYRGQVKILDFGLAKLAPGLHHRRQPDLQPTEQFTSQVGTTVGTISYMSPEQARGEDLDPRTDLFSFGVVLYEMATGRPSFPGATTAVVFDGILNRQPSPASALNAAIPAELDRIITKALEKERELRYQSAADLRADLQRLKRDSGLRPSAITLPTSEPAAATVVIPARDSALSSAVRAPGWSWGVLAIAGSVALLIVLAVAAMILTPSGPPEGAELKSVGAGDGLAPPVSMSGVPEPPAPSPVAPGSALTDTASAKAAPRAAGTPATPAAPVSAAASSGTASKGGALPPATPAPVPASPNADAAARERLDIARAKLNSNLLEPALADLRQIFIDFPSSAAAAEASFMSAEILERLGRLEEAMAAHIEFNKRFARDPRLPASKLRLAQLTLQSRQPDRETRARQILGEIAAAHPKTPHALAALQMKLKLEQGRGREMDPVLGIEVPRALPTLRALAAQFPTSPAAMVALNRLAELYIDIGDYPRAAQAYTDLATSFPGNPNDAWFRAGEIYERRLKDVDKARAAYASVPEGTARYRDAQRRLK